ncbi:adenosine deaminase family protein [Congregicoccus parvus]|uniref:adenosine deaminase family protein n=1 Tax=Congregicoccus parvus TaxID=3081749 RepID=UPI003FA5C5A2
MVSIAWADVRATALGAMVALVSALPIRAETDPAFAARYDAIVREATPARLYAFLYALPKGGDLHNHAGGSNLPEWMWTVLTDPARNGGDEFFTRVRLSDCGDDSTAPVRFVTLSRRSYHTLPACLRADFEPLAGLDEPTRAAWLSAFELDRPGEGRDEFFNVSVWTRLGDIGRNLDVRLELLVENMKAFGAEGVRYLETQFGAFGALEIDGTPIAPEEVARRVETRLSAPDAVATGVHVRFQETVLRFSPHALETLRRQYAFVSSHRHRWVGINMAGIEERGPGYPRRFLETFRELRRTHPTLPLSIHAGEMDGPNSHVRDTLLLGATRIGHGLNVVHDEDTLLMLQLGGRVLIEINLISNRLLEYVPDLRSHPFPEFLRTGVPVCLNTDDRGMWGSNMTDEYLTAVTLFGLDWSELVALGRASLEHAFVDSSTKRLLLSEYEADIAKFEQRFGAGSVADALASLDAVRPVAYGYARRTWGLEFPR